jgi:CRP-like cAMP-binding protein
MKAELESVLPDTHLVTAARPLGNASQFVDRIFTMIDRIPLFESFDRDEVRQLTGFMSAFRCPAGSVLLREGEAGDHMCLLIEGSVEILKNDRFGGRKRLSIVGPGKTLGEMSMIDGEPRFASCVATMEVVYAVLTRDQLSRIIVDSPRLGTKILMELVVLLSQRLRETSRSLVSYMESLER